MFGISVKVKIVMVGIKLKAKRDFDIVLELFQVVFYFEIEILTKTFSIFPLGF
jgi:hypothetical protein